MSVDFDALQKAQDARLTVGVVPKSGQTVVRLEIDDLLERRELANLYFLALESFMSEAIHENAFSYYEISGIHGQPARAWDNVTSAGFDKPGDKEHWPGYCAHGSVLFPLWHRAYLAQFEVILVFYLITSFFSHIISSKRFSCMRRKSPTAWATKLKLPLKNFVSHIGILCCRVRNRPTRKNTSMGSQLSSPCQKSWFGDPNRQKSGKLPKTLCISSNSLPILRNRA